MATFEHHRAAFLTLLLLVLPALAACDSSGSGTKQVTIRYAGDVRGYGISIRTGTAAGMTSGDTKQSEDVRCTMSAAAAAAGCTSRIATSTDGLGLALYGCSVEAGDELFDCELPSALVKRLRTDPVVHAGCGCPARCPTAPSVVVCEGDGPACGEAPLLEAAVADRPRSDIVATTQRNTRETTCSTCCETDFWEDLIGTVVSDEPISEIELVVTFSKECEIDLNGTAECEIDDSKERWGKTHASGTTLVQRFCLVASNPAEAALSVAALRCKGLIIDTTVTRALGPDFAPLSTMPTVEFD